MSAIFGNTVSMAEKSLDYLWQKQQVTMNNIANVDTPNYKTQSVSFEEEFKNQLQAASKTGDPTQIASVINNATTTVTSSTGSSTLDGNNVNTDVENVDLAKTTLQYQYELRVVNSDLDRMKLAIEG